MSSAAVAVTAPGHRRGPAGHRKIGLGARGAKRQCPKRKEGPQGPSQTRVPQRQSAAEESYSAATAGMTDT
jgi:hypothetical protein